MNRSALKVHTMLTAMSVTLFAWVAYAEDWPGWRGPSRNGVTTDHGVPVQWSATSGVRWKRSLPGSGISNPIVWQDHVICTSSDGAEQQDLHIVCLHRDRGQELWHARLWGTAPTLYHESKSSMASPSPNTDGQHVFAFFGTGDVFCFDMDGQLIWQRSLAAEYGPFENRFAASSSPLLFEDTVILQCDHYGSSYLIAIDKLTGKNRWKVDRSEVWLSWSSPVCAPLAARDAWELIVCGSEKIDSFDPRDGRKRWTFPGMARECIPTPLVVEGVIYATSGPAGTTYALRANAQGATAEPDLVWSYARGNPYVPSAILVAGVYYLVDDHGIATALDAQNGKPLWRKRLEGDFTASPVAADGRVYFTNEAGVTTVIRAGAKSFEELARNEIGEPVYASAAIAGGHFFQRTATHLWCLGD